MITRIPNLLTAEEIAKLRTIAMNAEFEDGKATAGRRIKSIKDNLQMADDTAEKTEVGQIVIGAIQRNDLFQSVALPKVIVPPTLSRYHDGMTYKSHVDAAIMMGVRADVSTTVFLNDPTTYDGGELTIDTGFGEQSIKLMAGEAVVYSTSAFHWVTPVTRGERLAAVTWMQSAVRRADQRGVLHDLRSAIQTLSDTETADDETMQRLVKTHANLLRMWTDI